MPEAVTIDELQVTETGVTLTLTVPEPPPPLPRWALELARQAVDLTLRENRCTIVLTRDGPAWQILVARPAQRVQI